MYYNKIKLKSSFFCYNFVKYFMKKLKGSNMETNINMQNVQNGNEKLDFEANIERVKEIIHLLNNENVNLKDGLMLYQKAQNYINTANKMLEEAEFELRTIIEQGN